MSSFISVIIVLLDLYIPALAEKASISGTINNLSTATLYCIQTPAGVTGKPLTLSIPFQHGRFTHTFSLTRPVHISIRDSVNAFSGFLQPGDSLIVQYDARSFTGLPDFQGQVRHA